MTHELKIWPQFYKLVAEGSKTFEVRKNDRDFQVGDEVKLKYFDPEWPSPCPLYNDYELRKMWDRDYPPMEFRIGYVLPIDSERVVFSLLPVGEK